LISAPSAASTARPRPTTSSPDADISNDKARFGLMFRRFAGRVLGGIRLNINETARKSRQHTYQFITLGSSNPDDHRQTLFDGIFGGHVGHVGHVANPSRSDPSQQKIDEEEKERREEINKGRTNMANMANIAIYDASSLSVISSPIAAHSGPVALDIETFAKGGAALDPCRGEIRLLSIAIPGRWARWARWARC
jgi:hypothetical protein